MSPKLATTILALSSMHAATAYLVLTPAGPLPVLSSPGLGSPLHAALNAWHKPWPPMHSLTTPFSHRAYKTAWPLYETAPALPSLHDLLGSLRGVGLREMHPPEHRAGGWQDQGEYVEQTFAVPRGFEDATSDEDAKTSALSAQLGDGMDKVVVQGSRAGLRFSRSLALPFELAAESDIELEHKPRSGLLTLRLRKPKEPEPAQPTALSIKRIEEAVDAAPVALPDADAAAAAQEQAAAAAAAAGAAANGESEQQALEEKFAFVKLAEATTEAAAATEAATAAEAGAEPAAGAQPEATAQPEAAAQPEHEPEAAAEAAAE